MSQASMYVVTPAFAPFSVLNKSTDTPFPWMSSSELFHAEAIRNWLVFRPKPAGFLNPVGWGR
jgi:hypothetical protein